MKLSEYKGKKGIEIAAKLIKPIYTLTTNEAVRKARNAEGATVDSVLSAMIMSEPEAAIELYAIINDKPVEEYTATVTAGTMIPELFRTFADDDLMSLFGLRGRATE